MTASRLKAFAGAALVLAAAAAPASAQWSDGATPDSTGAAVAREYIVGAWTDSGDCAAAVEFAGDGSFVSAEGEGMWALDGADLVLAGAGGVRRVRVIPVDLDTMEVIDEAGARGRSTRCGEVSGGDPNIVAVTFA